MSQADDALAALGGGPTTPPQSQADLALANINAPAPPAPNGAFVDGGNALGTGFWRGLTSLAGLPVDTVANLIDLGKAGAGTAYTFATGKAAPDALQLHDRSDVVGSGAWLQNQARKTSAGRLMIDPANPAYEGGYLQNSGAALTGVVSPNSRLELVKQLLLSQTGATAAKLVKDSGGSDASAIAVSLLPQGAIHYGAEGAKRVILGDPLFGAATPNRTNMQQRLDTLSDAGVTNPSMGLATGNRFVGGVENILSSTPGAVGVMDRSRNAAVAGMQNATEQAANLAAPNRGVTATGQGIVNGLGTTFKNNVYGTTNSLYDALDQYIAPQTPALVTNTLGKLDQLTQPIPGAPNVSKNFINGRIQSLRNDFLADTAGAPASVMVAPQPPRAGGGVMNAPIPQDPVQIHIPQYPPTNSLPWQAVKQTRTMVGEQLGDGILATGVPDRQWRSLYGSLSQDMQNAAQTASPAATQAFNRASNYNRAAMGRLEQVAPFANATTPEQAFNSLANTTTDRGSLTTLQAVKKSLPEDVRGQFAGTVIDRLGQATNGVQNAQGSVWSPQTFLTNWNKMSPKAREELFSGFPNSSDVKAGVEAVANAASMMRDNSGLWANPSGTGANWAARGALGAVGVGGGAAYAGLINPWIPAAAAGGMVGANVLARALTNKSIVGSVAQPTRLTPNDVQSLVRILKATGTGSP